MAFLIAVTAVGVVAVGFGAFAAAGFVAGRPPGGGLLLGRTRGSAALGRRIFIIGAPSVGGLLTLGSVGVAMLSCEEWCFENSGAKQSADKVVAVER